MKPQRIPKYMLPGPCVALIFQGRDGRWYRACVPCDTLIPAGGKLPTHLAYGWSDPGNAAMSVRDHMRQMAKNRHDHGEWLIRQQKIIDAARAGDDLLFGRLIMNDWSWQPREGLTEEDLQEVMKDHLRRTGNL